MKSHLQSHKCLKEDTFSSWHIFGGPKDYYPVVSIWFEIQQKLTTHEIEQKMHCITMVFDKQWIYLQLLEKILENKSQCISNMATHVLDFDLVICIRHVQNKSYVYKTFSYLKWMYLNHNVLIYVLCLFSASHYGLIGIFSWIFV